LAVVVILSASASLLQAEDKAKDLIVGKWEPVEQAKGEKITIEFTKDGKIHISGKEGDTEIKAEGTYKFIDDTTLEATINFGDEKKTDKAKIVKITKDEMVTKREKDKKEETFKRVK
jgi:uncharacterized protein (TIGR03066 family)